ncbi:MAG: endo-1,4-beta-xylanase, partial [Deltaproteobacteria bacterium]|nr:endo-1,4-beta-xylanase [Deltaproteobacteria bacterium]
TTLGETYLDEAFQLAHEADPKARLFLNEYFPVHSATDERVLAFRDLVARLLARGVPIHGVGIQAHFSGPFPFARIPKRDALEAMLRVFTDLGVVVELTELDISINYFTSMDDPLVAQAAAYAGVVAACMAVPGCQAVTTWGIDDGHTWLDGTFPSDRFVPNLPLLFDAALTEKPAYYAVRDEVAKAAGTRSRVAKNK